MKEKAYVGWLEEDSEHSLKRAKERASMNKKRAKRMMDRARLRGVRSEDCKWSVDRKFLVSRSNGEAEAVAYNGYCFILDRQTMNCITMFPLPKDFGKKKTYYTEEHRKSKFLIVERELEMAYL